MWRTQKGGQGTGYTEAQTRVTTTCFLKGTSEKNPGAKHIALNSYWQKWHVRLAISTTTAWQLLLLIKGFKVSGSICYSQDTSVSHFSRKPDIQHFKSPIFLPATTLQALPPQPFTIRSGNTILPECWTLFWKLSLLFLQ